MSPRPLVLLFLLAGFVAGPLACDSESGTTFPASATTTVFSLTGIDCEACGTAVLAKLKEQPGVYTASFDRVLAEVTVQHDASQSDTAAILAITTSLGYGAGHGEYAPEVEVESHLAPGKVTVVDFYAVWCEPCRKIDAAIAEARGQ